MPKILVADDSRFQVELLQKGLEAKGFEVVIAQDAVQAGMAARRTSPDAIVLDINMPGGSGVEVLKRLRQSKKTEQIPVVVVSGNPDPATQEQARKLGAVNFFAKPVDMEELAKALSELVALRPEVPQAAQESS